MKRNEVAALTYREMWETYVEPVLKAQAEIRQQTESPMGLVIPDSPATVEQKIADAQAVCLMFGGDPLEVGKAVRKSHGQKPDLEAMRAKLLARENGVKAS